MDEKAGMVVIRQTTLNRFLTQEEVIITLLAISTAINEEHVYSALQSFPGFCSG